MRGARRDIDLPWRCATPDQYQMLHVEARYYEASGVAHGVLRLFLSVLKSGSLSNKVHERVKTLVCRAAQLLTTSGKIVLPGGSSCVRRPPPNNQSIHRFSTATWVFCVILGWSDPDEWWWGRWLVLTSASPGVWNVFNLI